MDYPTKDCLLAIQVGSWPQKNHELGSISVWPRTVHRQKALVTVLEPDTFIRELCPKDALSFRTIALHNNVSAQDRLAGDDLTERAA